MTQCTAHAGHVVSSGRGPGVEADTRRIQKHKVYTVSLCDSCAEEGGLAGKTGRDGGLTGRTVREGGLGN